MVRTLPDDDPDDRRGRGRYDGKAKVGKLNVDFNGQTAAEYQIRGIPALLVFKGGQVVDMRVGALGKTDVQKLLDSHV